MKRKIHTQTLAEQDLIEIWKYSFEQWDEHRADSYLDELDRGIRRLAENPQLGAQRDYVREGYRVLFVSSHAIYYKVGDAAINIIRVLHGRMDPDKYL